MQAIIDFIYGLLWNNLITIPLPGGGELGFPLMVLMLVPAGLYFTIRTKFLPVRCMPQMLRISVEKGAKKDGKDSISGWQTLIVSTATRVGMGNMAGVVAAISAGGAGAVFWMWVTALLGMSTSYIESTLAQQHKEADPLYGGTRGGPAHYIHAIFAKDNSKKRIALGIAFAAAALLCWGGISQVIANSVSSALEYAFDIKPLISTIVLVAVSAVIVLRKNATVKVLDIIVPVMAVFYFALTLFIIVKNASLLPSVFGRIFEEAFSLKAVVGGGLGAALTYGVQRGLFSNEAGSGSAPCAAAAADVSHPAKAGLFQSFGVFIDTIIICTCTAMIMLLAPAETIAGLEGMPLLQAAMHHHFGQAGVIFIAIVLWLFCLSTFIGVLFYARSNVAYLFGDNWASQTGYKLFSLIMLFIGGIAAYKIVWQISDIGMGFMTIFNLLVLLPFGGKALKALDDYMSRCKAEKKAK